MTRAATTPTDGDQPPRGRKRDGSRDAAILDATLDILAEVGAEGLTMDLVATRAGAGKATIYRRWASKAALALDAVAHMKRGQVDLGRLPDTGTLRGDLLALFRPQSAEESGRRLRIMAGLSSLLAQDQAIADAAGGAVVEPWAEAHLALMRRAVERGEAAASADVEALSRVVPSMAAYRTLVERKPIDLAFLVSLVDGVLMPALRPKPGGGPAAKGGDPPAPSPRRPRTTAGTRVRPKP